MKRMRISQFFTILCIAVLILDSADTISFAARGIDLCIRTVIPSLFPFFVLSSYLTGNLHSGGGSSAILLSGFLGGYPVGAQAVSESRKRGQITQDCANQLLMFCSQAGPSFLFGMVAGQFPTAIYIWKLWAVQIFSALSVAALVPLPDKGTSMQALPAAVTLPDSMKQALRAMSSVCGWVVFFRVLLGFVSFLPQDGIMEVLTAGLLELANGCLLLGSVENLDLRFLLAAVMLNFGGICVLLQTASVIQGLNPGYYVLGKLLQTAFSVLYSLCFLGYYLAAVPVLGVLLLFRQRISGKNSSIPVHLGV